MFLSFVRLMVFWLLLVTENANAKKHQYQISESKSDLPRQGRRIVVNEPYEDARSFDNVREVVWSPTPYGRLSTSASTTTRTDVLSDLRTVLERLLTKLSSLDGKKKEDTSRIIISSESLGSLKDAREDKRLKYAVRLPRWGEWTPWSACSVSCGKGREIRWRHCLEECDAAETEMDEKSCQLPSCGPGKIFGFKL